MPDCIDGNIYACSKQRFNAMFVFKGFPENMDTLTGPLEGSNVKVNHPSVHFWELLREKNLKKIRVPPKKLSKKL